MNETKEGKGERKRRKKDRVKGEMNKENEKGI